MSSQAAPDGAGRGLETPERGWSEVDPSAVAISDPFWSQRREIVRTRTIPHLYRELAQNGALDALSHEWTPGEEPVPHVFWDSDIAKWIEAASYTLRWHPDDELDALLDSVIERLAAAQQPDGYLNTYFTLVLPGERFTDLEDAHELYCAGHIFEAAVAHFQATGKRTLLDVACRYADLIRDTFGTGPDQLPGYDGHEEIELALVRLAGATGRADYLELARYFVDQRGRQPLYFGEEARRRGRPAYFSDHFGDRTSEPEYWREYNQTHLPVREQSDAVGHAVRAVYLYCAVADLARLLGDGGLRASARRVWESLTERRMYLTAGIGSSARNEGFTQDYDLPNAAAYAETCAAIGLAQWAHRMTLLERRGDYADIFERALYNGILAGMSDDGTHFFYENPLESDGSVHRREWFSVACCPPNLARFLASLERFVYLTDEQHGSIVVNHYISSRLSQVVGGESVSIRQDAGFPWDGTASFTLECGNPVEFGLLLRVPAWATEVKVAVNGRPVSALTTNGYFELRREWRAGDRVQLSMPMAACRTWVHPAVAEDVGKVALQRGPIVYCLEGADNGAELAQLILPDDRVLREVPSGEAVHLVVEGVRERVDGAALYTTRSPSREPVGLHAVPYFSWDNRAPGPMRVWIRRS